eukprot:688708_1
MVGDPYHEVRNIYYPQQYHGYLKQHISLSLNRNAYQDDNGWRHYFLFNEEVVFFLNGGKRIPDDPQICGVKFYGPNEQSITVCRGYYDMVVKGEDEKEKKEMKQEDE